MNVPRDGGCACGSVRYRLASDPLFIHCCHCRNCQRQTGSAFVINLLVETERVELLAADPEPVDVPPIGSRYDARTQAWRRRPKLTVGLRGSPGIPPFADAVESAGMGGGVGAFAVQLSGDSATDNRASANAGMKTAATGWIGLPWPPRAEGS